MMLAISRYKDPKASPPYLSRYHLSQAPFSSAATAFYADPERTQSLDMLQHLTQYSEELLLVTGPDGIGKTSLLEQFLERTEEHWQVCRLGGKDSLEAERLFQHIAECFRLDLSRLAPQELLQGLQSQLSALQEQQLPVLLIDDAQSLSDDALEIVMHLATLEGEHGKLVRVLLFCDSSIEQRLAAERFAGIPLPHRLEMKALDENQTAAYINHRLEAAGYRGPQLFSDKEIRQIHRQSHGIPGRINEEAHEVLMHRMTHKRGAVASSGGRYLKMGLAATAIIGSVLGLHERINTILGGEEQAMTISTPERPVLRLAEEGNPWAVVIRDGERIQISCGAPGSDTIGVRPVMSAAAMVQQPMGMSTPLLEDVTPATGQEAPKSPVEQGGEPAVESNAVTEEEPAAQEAVASAQTASGQTPLVVKQAEPDKHVAAAEGETRPPAAEAPTVPAELKLIGTTPSPLIGSNEPRRIVLNGSGFMDDSKVAVSRAGKVEVLSADKVTVLDEGQIAIEVNTGIQPVSWAVQVSTPDNRRSNVLRFQVVAPPKDEKPAPEAPAETAANPEVAEPQAEPAEPVIAAPAVKPATPAKTEPVSPKATAGQKLQGSEWLAKQPKQNFTLQLLASASKEAIGRFARKKGLGGPLAHFVMNKGGKPLHVLTQGSYASRAEAEQAAKSLPQGISPWIRTLGSVQQVMQHEAKAAAEVSLPPTGAGIKDTAWLWSQDPGRYTIQLAAAESEQAIEAVMRRITLPGELVVVRTLRDGKPWYALIYGSFATREAARGTIARLPAPLKQAGPWPRSFASLQGELSRTP